MIISISGPSSAGKTTLINALRKRNEQYIFIHESFREFIKTKNVDFNNSEEAFIFQYELFNFMPIFQDKIDTVLILDRCHFDCLVYSTLHFLRLKNQYKYINQYLEIINKSLEIIKNIKIFLVQTNNLTIENDGIRLMIYQIFRQQEIELFNTLYSSLNINVNILPNSLQDRIDTIEQYLRK